MLRIAWKREAAYGLGCVLSASGAAWMHPGAGLAVVGLALVGWVVWQHHTARRRFGDLLVTDTAERAVRREFQGLAKAIAGGPAAVERFYAEHAEYLATAMHLSLPQARDYCQRHQREVGLGGAALLINHPGKAAADLVWMVQQQHGR